MPEAYRTRGSMTEGDTEALVVHCSAARYQQLFQEFLTAGLGLRRYSVIAVPGGVHALTLLDYLPKFAWAGWRWLKFLADADQVPRFVLIGHEECRWYRDSRFWHSRSTKERVLADLLRVRASLGERFPKARVDLYYARLADGRVAFDNV
jgi:hypothetical protein